MGGWARGLGVGQQHVLSNRRLRWVGMGVGVGWDTCELSGQWQAAAQQGCGAYRAGLGVRPKNFKSSRHTLLPILLPRPPSCRAAICVCTGAAGPPGAVSNPSLFLPPLPPPLQRPVCAGVAGVPGAPGAAVWRGGGGGGGRLAGRRCGVSDGALVGREGLEAAAAAPQSVARGAAGVGVPSAYAGERAAFRLQAVPSCRRPCTQRPINPPLAPLCTFAVT